VPLLLGLILLTRLIPRIAWLSRWAMAFVIGFAAGTNFTRYLQSDFVTQVQSTMVPLYEPQATTMATIGHIFSQVVVSPRSWLWAGLSALSSISTSRRSIRAVSERLRGWGSGC